jgi:hypothetical protein
VYDVDLRTDLLYQGEGDAPPGFYTWRTHFEFVQHQLQQLRAALALGTILNRTVVLPRLAVTCACFFFPGKDCVIDGHRVRLPHIAPSDHWLKPGVLKLPHREAGFLEEVTFTGKHLVPQGVRDEVRRISVPWNLTDQDLLRELWPYRNLAVLRFSHLHKVFGGFVDSGEAAQFESATADILGSWCCLSGRDHPDGPQPGVEVLRVRYTWFGDPKLVNGQPAELGRCGA